MSGIALAELVCKVQQVKFGTSVWCYRFLVWVMAQLDPSILQTAMLQVAEATQAASLAAQSAAQSAQQASTPAGSAGGQGKPAIDWSKLVNKLPIFGENSIADEDVKLCRVWLWQLTQFLVTIDSAYESEVKQVTDDPSKQLDLESASTETCSKALWLDLFTGQVQGFGNSQGCSQWQWV